MATYHAAIKVGHASKTIPHLDYINREGKYSFKKDLIYKSSGNMPSWAKNEKDFFEAAAANDKRSYREIEFALPNELTPEQQQEIVEEFIQENLPNNPYTYSMHEVDSAIHGIKNPHVHIMFSERILEGRKEELSREEFFKQRGVSKQGIEFGGTVKDRSWAGKGHKQKYLNIRKNIADLINKKYKKLGLPHRVDHRSLEDQSQDKILKGDVETIPTNTERAVRINDKAFRPYSKTIKNEIDKASLNDTLPIEIQERIINEKQKKLDKIKHHAIKNHNESLRPKVENLDYAYHEVTSETDVLAMHYHSPFKYMPKTFNNIKVNVPIGQESTNEYTKALAYLDEQTRQNEYMVEQTNPAQLIADLELNKERLLQEQKRLNSIDIEKHIESILTPEDKKVLQEINNDLKATDNAYLVATEYLQLPLKENSKRIKELQQEFNELVRSYDAKDITAEAKAMQDKVNKETFKTKPKQLYHYENKLLNQVTNGKYKALTEKIRSKKSAITYQKKQGNDTKQLETELAMLENEQQKMKNMYLTKDVKLQAKEMQTNDRKSYEANAPKPLSFYKEKVLNLKTDGTYFNLKNDLHKEIKKVKDVLSSDQVKSAIKELKTTLHSHKQNILKDATRYYSDELQKKIETHEENKKEVSIALKKIDQLLTVAKTKVKDQKEVAERKATTKRVHKKHKERKEEVAKQTTVKAKDVSNTISMYKKKNQPLSFYEDKVVDRVLGGALTKEKQKLRSKESIKKHLEKQGKDTAPIQKEIESIKETIQDMRDTYLTTTLRKEAKVMYETDKKDNVINEQEVRKKVKRITRKKYTSKRAKRICKRAVGVLNRLLKNGRAMSGTTLRQRKRFDVENMEGNDIRL